MTMPSAARAPRLAPRRGSACLGYNETMRGSIATSRAVEAAAAHAVNAWRAVFLGGPARRSRKVRSERR